MSEITETVTKQLLSAANGPGTYEIVVREGQAIKAEVIHDPSPVRLSGNIDAPRRWLEKRLIQVEPLRSYLKVNRDNLTMDLVINERDKEFKDTVSGKLQLDQAYVKVGINDDKFVTPKDMADNLRRNKAFFDTLLDATEVISKLQNFRARVSKIVEKIDDKKGNKVDHNEQAIQEINLPREIVFNIPIFKGQPKKVIRVDVEVQAEDLTVTLFSEDAYTVIDKTRDEAFDYEIQIISELLPGLPVIEV